MQCYSLLKNSQPIDTMGCRIRLKIMIFIVAFIYTLLIYSLKKSDNDLQREFININKKSGNDFTKERFALRSAHLKGICSVLNGSLHHNTSISLDQFFMTTNYNLLVCLPGKTGSSSIKRHFMMLNTGKKTLDRSKLKASLLLPKSELEDRIYNGKFIRVLSTRDPMNRLVSAYKDKFHDGEGGVEESTYKDYIDRFLPEKRGSTDISFSEFLKIVVAQRTQNNKTNNYQLDAHWQPAHSVCSACELPYDYIMKLETFEQDIDYIFQMAGINDRDTQLRVRQHETSGRDISSINNSYFNSVDHDLLREIYNIYKEDFQHFDYEIPYFLKNVILD